MAGKRIAALAAALALAALFALSGCVVVQTGSGSSSSNAASSNTASAVASSAAPSQGSYIGDQAAIDIALKDAGIASGDAAKLKAELDTDDVVAHYDVKLYYDGKVHKYEIDATTGEIMYTKTEVDD